MLKVPARLYKIELQDRPFSKYANFPTSISYPPPPIPDMRVHVHIRGKEMLVFGETLRATKPMIPLQK